MYNRSKVGTKIKTGDIFVGGATGSLFLALSPSSMVCLEAAPESGLRAGEILRNDDGAIITGYEVKNVTESMRALAVATRLLM